MKFILILFLLLFVVYIFIFLIKHKYKAALSALEAFTVQASGGPDPVAQGLVAYNAMGSFAQTLKVFLLF